MKKWQIVEYTKKGTFSLPAEKGVLDEIYKYFINIVGRQIDNDQLTFYNNQDTRILYNNNRHDENLVFSFSKMSPEEVLNALKAIKSQVVGTDGIYKIVVVSHALLL